MLKLKILFLLNAALCASGTLIGNAIFQCFNLSVGRHGKAISFVKLSDEKFNIEFDETITTIVSRIKFKFTIEDFNHPEMNSKPKDNKVFIIVDSLEAFNLFRGQFKPESYPFLTYFMIVVLKPFIDISEIFGFFWQFQLANVGIFLENVDGNIDFLTFFPKSDKSCNDVTPVVINTFINESWEKPFTFPEKFGNYHRCTVNVANYEAYGFEMDIFVELSMELNFTFSILNAPSTASIGNVYANGTSNGSMRDMLSGKIDMIIRLLALDEVRSKAFSFVNSFYEDWFIFVVPQSARLPPLAKLLHPFQEATWLSLAFFLLFAVFTIAVMERLPPPVYNFIIGQNIQHPYLNIARAFLGSSQRTLPKGSFARYLIALFLIFCLVVRTMYVGKLFAAMKSNMQSKEFTKIDEFYEANYKFYVNDGIAHKFAGLKYFHP